MTACTICHQHRFYYWWNFNQFARIYWLVCKSTISRPLHKCVICHRACSSSLTAPANWSRSWPPIFHGSNSLPLTAHHWLSLLTVHPSTHPLTTAYRSFPLTAHLSPTLRFISRSSLIAHRRSSPLITYTRSPHTILILYLAPSLSSLPTVIRDDLYVFSIQYSSCSWYPLQKWRKQKKTENIYMANTIRSVCACLCVIALFVPPSIVSLARFYFPIALS